MRSEEKLKMSEQTIDTGAHTRRNNVLARLKERHGDLQKPCDREIPSIGEAGIAGRSSDAVLFQREFNRLVANFYDKAVKRNHTELRDLYAIIQNYLNEHLGALPSYDIRLAQNKLAACRSEIESIEKSQSSLSNNQAIFSFRKKDIVKKTTNNKYTKPVEKTDLSNCIINIRPDYENLVDETFNVGTEKNSADLIIKNCTNCRIKINALPATLHIFNCRGCIVISKPVQTSILVDDIHNCALVIACQQLRMHRSKNVRLFLAVQSTGILEQCTEIKVSKYCLPLPENERNENWQHLKDFDWLLHSEQSPNWSVENRTMEETSDFDDLIERISAM